MAEEVAVYHDENIHVTNLRAMLQGKTYAMANVTSVSMFTQIKSKAPGVILAVLGGLFLLAGFVSRDLRGCSLFFGGLMLVIGIAGFALEVPRVRPMRSRPTIASTSRES